MQQLLDDYRALQGSAFDLAKLLPNLSLVYLDVARSSLIDKSVIEMEIDALERNCVGWTQRQSGVYRTPIKKDTARYGAPLTGEWLVDEATSVHLRPAEQGGWRSYTYTEIPTGDGEAKPVLRERMRLKGTEGTVLLYSVYWGTRGQQALSSIERVCARFCGFVEVGAKL